MTNHGQDDFGRDITSEVRPDGRIRYHVTFDGEGILFIDQKATVPFAKVLDTINAHAPSE